MSDQDYITETELPGVFVIKRPSFPDGRGFFREIFRTADLNNRLGFDFLPLQANHSRSVFGTLRGIHIAPWHKLVSVMSGSVQQIVVDTRKDSKTFRNYISVNLGEENYGAVFVPAGCGNAFLVTSEQADYMYLATDTWAPGRELYVKYNDPDLHIAWQNNAPLVSEKDLQSKPLSELF